MREDGAAKQSGGTGLVTAGVVIAVVVAAGAYFGLQNQNASDQQSQRTDVEAETPVPVAQEPVSPADSETAEAAPSDDVPDTNEGPAEEVAVEAVEVEQVTPSVEEVRLEEDGLTVIAGRAEPGATVTVLVDGVEVATAVADARGTFAAVGVIAPSDTAQVLTLQADGQDVSVASADEIILAPLAKPLQQAEAEKPDQTAVEEETETAQQQGTAEPEATEDVSGDDLAVVTVPEGETDAQTSAAEMQENAVVAVADPAVAPEQQPEVETATTEVDPAVETAVAPPESNTVSATEKTETDPLTQTPDTNAEPAQVVAEASTDPETEDTPAPLPEDDSASTESEAVAPQGAATSEAESATPELADAVVPETPAPAAESPKVAVLKSTPEGVELLQPAQEPKATIVIDTIGYSEAGDVQLAGRAVAGTAEVRIYLNNQIVATMTVAPDGRWRGSVQNVAAGIYTLRADAVDPAGEVTSRVETPFKREAPAVLAAATEGQTGPVSAITVQTGDTLWAIARDRYGEGVLYVRVVEANRDAIRDPDLIYPGQIFDLPGE